MKPDISTDRTKLEGEASMEEAQPAETNRKQSLNLKVRARVGVSTRTQLHGGSSSGESSPTMTRSVIQ